jgi:hypothetical protein
MPLPRSPACLLSCARLGANRPSRDRQSFHAARKVRGRVVESVAQSGSGRSARPTSVRVLMAFSRSLLDGDLSFFPVVQSAAVICRLWCVSLPYRQLDTNLTPKRGSTLHHYRRQAFPEPHGYRTETCADILAGVPTGGQVLRKLGH